eukprot:30414-Pelagococcus_subviridis.AAC.1
MFFVSSTDISPLCFNPASLSELSSDSDARHDTGAAMGRIPRTSSSRRTTECGSCSASSGSSTTTDMICALGRYFAMSCAVFPVFPRHTMSCAPTLCAERTADDASDSSVSIGIFWRSMTCLNTE